MHRVAVPPMQLWGNNPSLANQLGPYKYASLALTNLTDEHTAPGLCVLCFHTLLLCVCVRVVSHVTTTCHRSQHRAHYNTG